MGIGELLIENATMPFLIRFCTHEIQYCNSEAKFYKSKIQFCTNSIQFTEMKLKFPNVKLKFASNAKINFKDMKYIFNFIYLL